MDSIVPKEIEKHPKMTSIEVKVIVAGFKSEVGKTSSNHFIEDGVMKKDDTKAPSFKGQMSGLMWWCMVLARVTEQDFIIRTAKMCVW